MDKELYSPEQLQRMLSTRNVLEVSRRSGVPYVTLCRLRSGNNPKAETLHKLTRFFDDTEAS